MVQASHTQSPIQQHAATVTQTSAPQTNGFSATDSLHQHKTDYSGTYPFPLFGTADSLSVRFRATEPLSHEVSAESVFGAMSMTVQTGSLPTPQPQSLTDNAVFQGFVLLLAATYALLLYNNLDDVRMLLGRISRDTASGKRLSEDMGSSGFSRFLNTVTAIGMLFIGVMIVKYSDALIMGRLHDMLPQGAVLLLSLLATAAFAMVVLIQQLTVKIAGAVTLHQSFVSQLVLLRRTYFSLAVIITSPTLLLFALGPRDTGSVWFILIVIELVVTVILYLRETLNLFLTKKISILHWFLYLCAVEIFPISFFGLMVAR